MDESNRSIAKRQIARLLGSSTSPICVISEEDTVVFANDAMGEFVGRSPDSLLGVNCGSPVPNDGDTKDAVASFLSLPINWSRQVLKLLSEYGPIPGSQETETIHSASTSQVGPAKWIRCLIPLELETGCILCVYCPSHGTELIQLVDEQASQTYQILRENRERYSCMDDLWYLQGKSNATRRALEQVQVAISNPLPLAIIGRKGCGRSWLAQTIQKQRRGLSSTASKWVVGDSLLRIDCALMDIELLLSMLEVVDESKRNGRSEVVVLMENLEELPDECVASLSAFLNRHDATVRMVTYDPLLHAQHHSQDFSWKDLLSRVCTIRIDVPALSERLEDLPTLIAAWFHSQDQKGATKREIDETFLDAIQAYSWPGGIEEFAESLSYATKKASSESLTERDLPVNIRTCVSHVEHSHVDESVDLDSILEDVERRMIMQAIERYPQNKTAAAKILNISRARLLRRLQQWGIQSESGTPVGDEDLPDFSEVQ